jgi:hypothetical protein
MNATPAYGNDGVGPSPFTSLDFLISCYLPQGLEYGRTLNFLINCTPGFDVYGNPFARVIQLPATSGRTLS